MDTKHFAIQDWVAHNQINLAPFATANNISDDFTKALGQIKIYEQTDVLMGCRIPPYVPNWIKTDHLQHYQVPGLQPNSSKPPLLSALETLHE
jgi:hypothetical protein